MSAEGGEGLGAGIRCVLCLEETDCDRSRQEKDAFSRLFADLWPTHVEVTGFHNRVSSTVVLGEKERSGVCVCVSGKDMRVKMCHVFHWACACMCGDGRKFGVGVISCRRE